MNNALAQSRLFMLVMLEQTPAIPFDDDMTDKSSPEWTAFATEVVAAVDNDRLGMDSVWILDHAPTLEAGWKSFVAMKREYGEFRLLRDMEQARLDSKRRWLTITGAMALGFAALVVIAYFISKP